MLPISVTEDIGPNSGAIDTMDLDILGQELNNATLDPDSSDDILEEIGLSLERAGVLSVLDQNNNIQKQDETDPKKRTRHKRKASDTTVKNNRRKEQHKPEGELKQTGSVSNDINSGNSATVPRKGRKREYNLRASSVINRIETERRRKEPRQPKPKAKPPPLSKYRRRTANARERTRMKDINDAFEELRLAVPALSDKGKMTKIVTLRMAMNYIAALREMLGRDPLGEPLVPGDSAGSSSGCSSAESSSPACSNSDSCCSPVSSYSPFSMHQGVSSDSASEGRFSPTQCFLGADLNILFP